ncbi:unnamed protein product [Bursaphelenchus okinawaensis]|uniref:F-box domain-containing protein n=1 Tax=Bursaphelenchus okinawaensis TaxID=465554 RepID=A0A811KLE8_9BILA|nr:unnamed protein product [Bursaphelenchus okinawaensis]CAG9107008.1 unnamed protein product [Bursaphelenchus okinawaensis]
MNGVCQYLPNEVWQKIFAGVSCIDSLASLASIDKNFYKLIKRDFKKMCYRNCIFRFEGETWAMAFSWVAQRVFNLTSDDSAKVCIHSGKMVFCLKPHCAILSQIDLSNFEYELIKFKDHFTEPVEDIVIINKGTRLIISCDDPTLDSNYDHDEGNNIQFYDLKTQKEVYERCFKRGQNWRAFSQYGIQNRETGEYIMYNPIKKQFYSTFIYCQKPSYESTVACNFKSTINGNPFRNIDECKDYETPFFFDYSTGKSPSPEPPKPKALA